MANIMAKDGVTFKWNGEEVARRAEKAAQISSFEVGLIVEAQAKLLSPWETGRLRSSITTVSGAGQRTKPRGKGAVATDVLGKPTDEKETVVGTPVKYGPYVEFGTFAMDAQPYLRPALDIVKGRKLSIVKQICANGKVIAEFGDYLNPRGKMTFEESVEAQI